MKNKLISFYSSYSIYLILLFGFLAMFTYVFPSLAANEYAGITYRGIVSGLAIIVAIVGYIVNRHIPNKKVLILLAIYIVGNILAIFIAPTMIKPAANISPRTYVMAVGLAVINALSIIVYLSLTNHSSLTDKNIKIICYIMMAFGVFLAIFSYCAQHEAIYQTFTNEHGWNYDVTSIFYSKTIYGLALLVTSLFTIVHIFRTKHYWWYLLVIFFLANMLISRSKTPLLFVSLFLIVLFIYHLLDSFYRHKIAWIISISVVVILLILLSLFIFVPSLRNGFFNDLYNFLTKTIINDGKVVIEDRLNKYGYIFSHLNNPFLVIFGCGEKIAIYLLYDSRVMVGDSVYVTNYATGGLIKFSLYLLLVIYVTIFNFKKANTKQEKFLSLSISLVILLSGLLEDDNLYGIGMIPLFLAPLFYSSSSLNKETNKVCPSI